MRNAKLKIKKTIKTKVLATHENVKIRFPKQTIGQVCIVFKSDHKEVVLKQFELILTGDRLRVVTVK